MSFLISLVSRCGVLVGVAALSMVGAHAADGGQLAAQLCAACHGAHGRSESPMFPRLDGQTSEYIQAQLKGFREHARGETDARAYMWGIASQLDDATVRSLGDYYASQSATPGPAGNPALMDKGKVIFEQGVPEHGVPACSSCHGPQALGKGAFPRLAGQHQSYLLRQIELFKTTARANAPVMSAVAHQLSTDDALAVSS
jgi:cytochrome c553